MQTNNPPLETIQNQSSSNPSAPKLKNWPLIIISLLFLISLGIMAFLSYQNFQLRQQIQKAQAKPTPIPLKESQPTQTPAPVISKITPTIKDIVIPDNWQEFTAVDPDFGLTTTMSLPPDFSFRFTGSEFTIQNDFDATELWDYSTSISGSENGPKNYYTGGSRRTWYQKYLNGEFSHAAYFEEKVEIKSIEEHHTGTSTYLEIKVTNPFGISEKIESHYIYTQNNILHILKPVSEKAYSTNSLIAKNIAIIFTSLKSNFAK